MPSKNAIVSFANHHGRYVQNLARLSDSLRDNFDGDFLGFVGDNSVGAEPHHLNPYNFKIHAIQKAIDAGYENILYLDSSCFAVNNVQPIFDMIESQGNVAQMAGHLCSTWTNDRTLAYFGITRDDAEKMPMIGNAGFFGMNTKNKAAIDHFTQWKQSMLDGMFVGRWDNNEKTESLDERCKGFRHDMSCNSVLFNILGMMDKAIPGDQILMYGGIYSPLINEGIILKAQG